MSLIETKNGRTVLMKAESMMLVPYVYDSTYDDHVLGSDVYDISAIIGDSIVIEQSDGDSVTKENEFTNVPLLQTFTGVRYAFTAQCLDLQNAVLKSVFGAMTVNGVDGAVAFQDDYTLIYALVRVRFKDTSLPDVILPKVQLNSKLLINQLKTRASQGNIGGVAFSRFVAVRGSGSSGTVLQFNNPTTYTPTTPVMFVPRTHNVLVLHHKGNAADIYSDINFNTGVVSDNISVNPTTGAWSLSNQQSGGGSNEGAGSENNNE